MRIAVQTSVAADEHKKLVPVPSETVAVVRFSGHLAARGVGVRSRAAGDVAEQRFCAGGRGHGVVLRLAVDAVVPAPRRFAISVGVLSVG